MTDIIDFINSQRVKNGKTLRQLSLDANLNASFAHGLTSGKFKNPSYDNVKALLKELNCRIEIITPEDDAYEPAEAYIDIPLLGVAEAGAIDGFDPITFSADTISAPRPFAGYAAIRIDGVSMNPVYESGDAALIKPKQHTEPHEVMGRDAICELQDGNALLKRVSASANGKFNLHSYHPAYPPLLNVEVRRFHRVLACLKQPEF